MLEVVLLGEFRVRSGGSLLTGLQPARTQALVGYLVLHRGTPQARQRIASLFWPDSTEAQARTNLRRELHQVRRCLPDPEVVLVADPISVWWRDDAPATVDVVAFESAADRADAAWSAGDTEAFTEAGAAAVAAYRGDLLPALYDDWVLDERDRLSRRCVSLLDRLIQTGTDDPHQVIAYARRRVELQPLEEVGHRTLIKALAQIGDRSAAVQAYHRCLSTLERELDVTPSPETTALYERLFTAPVGAPAVPSPRGHETTQLVGRNKELAALEAAWERARDGGPGAARLIVITGEAGIGKSRIAEELLTTAREAGAAVARSRCFAGDHPLPLAPVSEWLRSDAVRPAVERLDVAWRLEVARLVPQASGGRVAEPAVPQPAGSGDGWQRHRFFEGLVRALLAVERPMALLLDDLQWCDLDTLTWLDLCFHLGADAPVLIVTTARTEEVHDNADLVATISRLRAAGVVVDMELGPLAESETAELATRLLGPGQDAMSLARLHELTGGFPLFVVEAVRNQRHAGLDTLGSPRVQAVLEGRLSQLSAAAYELAGLSAAVGRDFSVELLTAASELDTDRVVDALDELWRRRIVREHAAGRYDFTHDLLRAAAYDGLSPPRQRGAHRRLAEALVSLGSASLGQVAAQVADQYDRAGLPDRAVPYYRQAARASAEVFAYREAVRLAERGLRLLPALPAGLERDREELEFRIDAAGPRNAVGGWTSAEAGANVAKIRELSERTGDRSALVESQIALWGMAFVRGSLGEALTLARQALSTAGDDAGIASYGHLAMGGSLTSAGELERALKHFDLATSGPRGVDWEILGFAPRVMAWAWGAHACWLVGRVGDASVRAGAALAEAEELTVPFGRAVAIAYAAITHQLRGDRDETLRRAREIRDVCARYDVTYYQYWSDVLEGWLRGGPDGADQIGAGIERLREHGVGSRLPYYLALQADVLIEAGHGSAAAAVLAAAREEAERHEDWWWFPELVRLEARLQPGSRGEDTLGHGLELARRQGSSSLALRTAVDLSARWLYRGERDRAAELVLPVRAGCSGSSPELSAIDAWLRRSGLVEGTDRSMGVPGPPGSARQGGEHTIQ